MFQRSGPSGTACGCDGVANTGDRKPSAAPARRARTRSGTPCADAVSAGSQRGIAAGRRPDRRCTPARSAAANRQSPATLSDKRRARHRLARSRPSRHRPGEASSRSTTPASPRGSRATVGRGSPRRPASVNSQSGGGARPPPRALTARAQATSLLSMNDPSADPAVDGTIAANLARVRAGIDTAAARAGRPAGSVALVAVTKTHPGTAVQAALAAGQTLFGENRVQEAAAKFPALRAAHPDLRLHLIGGLQTNKARDAVRLADVIESLDRPRLADAIADAAAREGRLPTLFVQVNTGDEPQKGGVARAGADAFVAACQDRFGPALAGLMCVPPASEDPAPHFAWLAACAARHGLAGLSMGMSADYAIAIACGATLVRVGTAIFGHRPPL